MDVPEGLLEHVRFRRFGNPNFSGGTRMRQIRRPATFNYKGLHAPWPGVPGPLLILDPLRATRQTAAKGRLDLLYAAMALPAPVTGLLTVATVLACAPLAAQDAGQAPEEAARQLDRVVVTGTRLTRIDVEGPLPISTIERAEIEASGRSTLSDLLRDLPFNSFGTELDAPNFLFPGQRMLNLRGLGAQYTVVLLDGQRLPGFSGVAGGGSTSVAGLPQTAIERVEVLRDGASAVYGSEAIGGVVNLACNSPRASRCWPRSGPTCWRTPRCRSMARPARTAASTPPAACRWGC